MSTTNRQGQALKDQLQNIADAVREGTQELTNFRTNRLREGVPKDLADVVLDYSVIRHLLGQRTAGASESTFTVGRKPGTDSDESILVFDQWMLLPDRATTVAAFIGPGSPTDEVPLTRPNSARQKTMEIALPNVPSTIDIARLELRDAHGYPIALGPRLAGV